MVYCYGKFWPPPTGQSFLFFSCEPGLPSNQSSTPAMSSNAFFFLAITPYQFESPSSYAFPFSWPAIDKRHLLSCPAPTTTNNGTIHARLPRTKKLGTWRDIWPQVVLLHQ